VLRQLGVRPSKRLGQSFLVDPGVVQAFADAARAFAPQHIVEIGPGLGAVTEALALVVPRLTAIEVDGRLAQRLAEAFADRPSVQVLHEDVLDHSFSGDEDILVVGSIPYAITGRILQHLVEGRSGLVGAVLLTQREVAEKIAASPGPDGSALGVLVRAYADVERIRRVSRGCFFPEPDVDSALWTVCFLEAPRFSADAETFFAVVRAIYGARRKMLRSALRGFAARTDARRALELAEIDPTDRGETLGFDALDRLAVSIRELGITLGRQE
jgi:16S rRNA (adenine1518-N6/adenine1519-N6)-dimethyltransferase